MKKKKIFIVEDNSFYAHILESILLKIGDFEIEKFESGQACINNAFKQPDIIFLDYYLGDIDGFEVLREVKSTYPDIHIVVLSGQKELKVAIRSLRFGATDYLLKDVDDNEEKLTQIISDCSQISEARKVIKTKSRKNIFSLFWSF